ncbi:PAS domain-containing protein, partial [Mitsuokella jalaludinii]
MPRNLSAWIDLSIHLFVILMLIGILSCYNYFIAAIAFVIWLCLAFFVKERCHDRSRRFERYCRNVVRNLNEMMNYAIEDLPQGILIVNQEGRIQWCNERMAEYAGKKPEQDTDV